MTTTDAFSSEARTRLSEYLFTPGRYIPAGFGRRESACSLGAINLALRGELTGEVPKCMSLVVGYWISIVQGAMPSSLRNSERWKRALIEAAGTGREHEDERLALVMTWMWETVLPTFQPTADAHGFGAEWRAMCEERTLESAFLAERAATLTGNAAIRSTGSAAAGIHSARAVSAANLAQRAILYPRRSFAPRTYASTTRSVRTDAWPRIDPAGLLERLAKPLGGEQT